MVSKINFYNKSSYDLLRYDSIHIEIITGYKGGGFLIYIKSNFKQKLHYGLTILDGD